MHGHRATERFRHGPSQLMPPHSGFSRGLHYSRAMYGENTKRLMRQSLPNGIHSSIVEQQILKIARCIIVHGRRLSYFADLSGADTLQQS